MAFRHRVWTSIVDFQLLVLLLVRPHLRAVASVLWLKVLWLKSLRDFERAFASSVAALPRLPKWLCSPIPKKGSLGKDVADGGIRAAVSLRRVWVEIFPTVVSSEFRDPAGGVCQPDDAAVFGARPGAEEDAERPGGEVEFAFGVGLGGDERVDWVVTDRLVA